MIAAVRSPESAEIVLKTSVQVVFLVEGDLFAYIPVITKLAEAGRFVFVHLDLIDGIGKDPAGLRFMAEHTAITGIISTKSTPLKHAAACRLPKLSYIQKDVRRLPPAARQFNLVFMDAPYNMELSVLTLSKLFEKGWLTDDAIIIVETAKMELLEMPPGLKISRAKAYFYGAARFTFVRVDPEYLKVR